MKSRSPAEHPCSIIYQAAKLGDIPYLLKDFELARQLDQVTPIGRTYGNSSGALVALAHGIVITAHARPDRLTPQALDALTDFESFFRAATSRDIRRVNWRGLAYGVYNLDLVVLPQCTQVISGFGRELDFEHWVASPVARIAYRQRRRL